MFIVIREFSCWGESDLWSGVWPAMYGVICLSILLEGGVTASNTLTKRGQNGFKIGTREKFATHLRLENFTSNETVIYTFFLRSAIFPYNSLYTQAVANTRILSLGNLCLHEGMYSTLNSNSVSIQYLWHLNSKKLRYNSTISLIKVNSIWWYRGQWQ